MKKFIRLLIVVALSGVSRHLLLAESFSDSHPATGLDEIHNSSARLIRPISLINIVADCSRKASRQSFENEVNTANSCVESDLQTQATPSTQATQSTSAPKPYRVKPKIPWGKIFLFSVLVIAIAVIFL